MKSTLILSKINLFCFFCFLVFSSGIVQANYQYKHAIAMHGEPKYTAHFSAFDYVNPKAPKTGELKQSALGSFDTFNPFTINGIAPAGIGLMHDTLMKSSSDEPFSLYGLIADGVFILPEQKGVVFHINPQARFQDGTPITADDVIFSFNILKNKGIPTYRYYYQDVDYVEKKDNHTIVFHFKNNSKNRELPFILGELPILSAQFWQNKDFEKTSLQIPIGSGPYVIDNFKAGRSISYKRNPNYWAKDLNVNKGYYNFDTITYDYYRDTTVILEAFKAGLFDLRQENEAKKWIQFKNEKNVQNSQIKMIEFNHGMPSGMQGFVFNLRRPIFNNLYVRQAISLAFDFEWMNQNLFYDLYQRTNSFFDNSYLKAPQEMSQNEIDLWKKLEAKNLKKQSFHLPENMPQTMRQRLKLALDLLNIAGWHVHDGMLKNSKGELFQFEILLNSANSATWERVVLPFVGQLKRLGIQVKIRTVDVIQYKNRLDTFDYDMIVSVWGQSLSPGNEQRYFWSSQAAKSEGSMNYSGINQPVIDTLIEYVIEADTQEDLIVAVQALDRALLSEQIVIPHWYSPVLRFVMWDTIKYPTVVPMKGPDIMTWWKE